MQVAPREAMQVAPREAMQVAPRFRSTYLASWSRTRTHALAVSDQLVACVAV